MTEQQNEMGHPPVFLVVLPGVPDGFRVATTDRDYAVKYAKVIGAVVAQVPTVEDCRGFNGITG